MTSGPPDPRSARLRPGGAAAAALLIGIAVAGCSVAPPSPSPRPTGSAPVAAPGSPGPSVTPSPAPAASPGDEDPLASATPVTIPEATSTVPLRAVTLVCESWGSEPPPDAIDCKTAAQLALVVLGAEAAAAVRRLDVGYGEWCDDPPSCPERRPDVGWVQARAATLETVRLRIARDPSAGLQIWPPVPGPRIVVPAFRAPPRAAPDLGGGAPAVLAGREAFPFCGREDVGRTETYDTAARRCFLDGVMAGSPVELISRPLLTEPDPSLLSVYRFTGEGAIFHYHRSAAGWALAACGISPIATPAVFVLGGACEQRRL